ncbi:hypothetical protein DIS24_g8305 [Lasiodiplodia hormozganensis]|uniref:Transcription factor Iwr1 domain-containing protein n=1 Tax=Lasiodiplodia hormozganensis TaxID=869390 RepID=A0AA39Y3E2_9PEZI|nr:hypothetical protein DIS24_g8305 [Lasiodiplodia hormozganensis]
MSQHVLPHTVRIKRKRQDEPVETLHVHHTPQDDPKKRRFTLDQPASSYPAVFRRVLQQDPAVAGASSTLDGSTSSLAAAGPTTAPNATTSSGPVSAAATAANDSSAAPSRTDSLSSIPSSSDRKILAPAPATRRFHLSTKSAPSRSSSPGGSLQKRKNVATLVESKPKKTRTAGGPEIAEYVAQKAAAGRDGSGHDVEMQVDHEQPAVSAQQQQPTTLKRPGRTARSASPAIGRGTNGATTTTATATAAAAAGNGDAGKSGKAAVDLGLLSEMQKFAQEVEHAEERKEKLAPSTPAKPTPIYPPTLASPPSHQKLKFQPKATPRFRDRHPERFANNNGAATAAMDIDNHHAESESDDDGDYVYDTYVRYDGPPDTVIDNATAASALPPDIGVLVINVDEQPLWEAYLEQNPAAEDSDKEFDTDDEDENAEDFYANEYPEDEVASDDERDEGAYRYRVAASDEEEWGMYSDEEDLGRPWGRRPAWLKGGSGDEGSGSD